LARVWEDSFQSTPLVSGTFSLRSPVDAPDCVVVARETDVARLLEYQLARRVIWWSDVDRFARSNEALRQLFNRPQGPLEFAFDGRLPVVHWARSEYARSYLHKRGASATLLGGYLEPTLLADAKRLRAHERSDLVLVDTRHGGGDLIRQIQARMPRKAQWIALDHLSDEDLPMLFARAKAYLDFGPQRDFSPILATAVVSGAVALVGTRGIAGNDADLPLPADYKFDERAELVVESATAQLMRVLDQHAEHQRAQLAFCEWVEARQVAFVDQVFTCLGSLEAAIEHAQRVAV
jgi:hypothetical protein